MGSGHLPIFHGSRYPFFAVTGGGEGGLGSSPAIVKLAKFRSRVMERESVVSWAVLSSFWVLLLTGEVDEGEAWMGGWWDEDDNGDRASRSLTFRFVGEAKGLGA